MADLEKLYCTDSRVESLKKINAIIDNMGEEDILNLPVFCANSGNVDENGNADLLYLPSMGTQVIPFQLDGTLTLTSGAMYRYSADSSKINFTEWTNTGGSRSSVFDYIFTTQPQCPCVFSAIKTGQANGYLTITATAYYDDGTNEVVFNESVPTTATQFSCGQQGQKLIKLNFECYYTYTSGAYSNAIVDITPITETITVSTSTQAFFKVGGNYPKLVATNTEKTFEKSYLEPLTVETDGTYNVFISETINPYALANTIYRQKSQPTANINDVWLNTAIQPYKAYKYNGSEWEEFLDVPIGSMVVSGGIITSVETFPYNNTSIDKPENIVVVETYQNGTSWYRVYSDGWCEQGGINTAVNSYLTVTLLKEYRNINYLVFVNNRSANSVDGTANKFQINISNVTTTSFKTRVDGSFNGQYWEAKGYIK